MNKKITGLLLMFFVISIFSVTINTVDATTYAMPYNYSGITNGYSFNEPNVHGVGMYVTGNNQYLQTVTVWLKAVGNNVHDGGGLSVRVYENGASPAWRPAGDINSYIDTSLTGTDVSVQTLSNTTYLPFSFQFTNNILLDSSKHYTILFYQDGIGVQDAGVSIMAGYSSSNGGFAEYISNNEAVWDYYSYYLTGNVITSDEQHPNPQVTPTPAPPSGSVAVNFIVENSLNYNQHGNITWTALQEGIQVLDYVVANTGVTCYFNDGLDIQLKPQLATGWYFWNYTVINNDGTAVYPIDMYALNLDSTKGTYNITMGISQTPNTVNVTLVNVAHGTIYFQDFINGQFQGARYGAGTYNIQYGHTIQISTLPNTGYKTDYFTQRNNGLDSIVTGSTIVLVCLTNTTITPHYVIDTGDGSTINYDNSALMSFFVYFLLLFVPPLAIAGILGKYTHSGGGAVIGFVGGLILMLVVGVIVGFIPFWAVIIMVLLLVVMLWLVFRGLLG